MVENLLFVDSEDVGKGKCFTQKICFLVHLDAWFLKIILLGYAFFVAAIIRYVAKVFL